MNLFIFFIIGIAIISTEATKHYYVFKLQKLNWHAAFNDCMSRGLHLATVNSAAEQKILDAAVRKSDTLGQWLWIGATDQGEEGSFLWMPTGKAVSYNYWGGDQPDDAYGGEDCVNIWHYGDRFTWNDLRCIAELYYICEDKPPCDEEGD